MVRRFGFLVLALFALSASGALACNEPSLGSVTLSAGAGDPVSFSAVHLDPGAAYTLVLGGRTVASGTAAGDAIDGTFAMPDLGSAGAYYLELDVAHEGGTWISSRLIQFVVPAAPAPAPAAKPRAAARGREARERGPEPQGGGLRRSRARRTTFPSLWQALMPRREPPFGPRLRRTMTTSSSGSASPPAACSGSARPPAWSLESEGPGAMPHSRRSCRK